MLEKYSVVMKSLQSGKTGNSIPLRWKCLGAFGMVGAAVFAPSAANAALVLQTDAGVVSPAGPILPFSGGTGGVTQQIVTPGSIFSIAVVGFNNLSSGSFLTSVVTPTFGGTTVYSGDALSGQALTVTSSEVIGLTTTTDSFSISVPTNFAPTGTGVGTQNTAVTTMEADIGAYNAAGDPITFLLPINPATNVSTGTLIYGTTNTVFALAPAANDIFGAGDTTLGSAEGVNAGGGSVESFGFHTFTFSFSYATTPVPEPTTAGALLGTAGLALLRRRKPNRIL